MMMDDYQLLYELSWQAYMKLEAAVKAYPGPKYLSPDYALMMALRELFEEITHPDEIAATEGL